MTWKEIIKISWKDELRRLKEEEKKVVNTVKCAGCGSTNLTRSIAAKGKFGKWGQKGSLTCKDCGYVWTTGS